LHRELPNYGVKSSVDDTRVVANEHIADRILEMARINSAKTVETGFWRFWRMPPRVNQLFFGD
jgi:hypothetical protein